LVPSLCTCGRTSWHSGAKLLTLWQPISKRQRKGSGSQYSR
jgi:hypothetical protein